jgi:transcription-repair coupling factor (superfamily II helicase)
MGLSSSTVPQVKFEIAHGQMAERAQARMLEFLDKRAMCSSDHVIEVGARHPERQHADLDRADTLGLAQLYHWGASGRSRITPTHI